MSTHRKLLVAATGLALLTGASCQNHDVCSDVVGSCLSLRVEGDGPFDSLRTTLDLIADVAQQRVGDTPGGPGSPGAIELPMTLRIVPPDDVKSSEVMAIELGGIRNDTLAATAKSPPGFSWPYDTHQQLTLRLEATTDLTDGGTGDMTGPADLGPPAGDLATPPTTLKWRTEPTSGRAGLYGVWAGGTQAFAVGDSGTILSRQGDGTWRTDTSGTMVALDSVTGFAGSGVWTVGQSPGAWRRDTKWNPDVTGLNLGTGGELLSVAAGATPGELWAGDRDGRVWHRTGPTGGSGTWQAPEQVFPTGQIVYGVASAGGAVFAVGDSGRVARRADSMPGTAWKTFQYQALPTGDPFTLNAACAFDKDNAVAVGTGGQLVRYSGSWQATPQVVDAQKTELFGVWGVHADRVWAVGNSGLIVRVEGTRNTELARTAPQSLYGIFGRSETDIFVVGFAMGSSLILHGTP